MKRLDGKVAVITGGTSGIGLATAKLFHAEGAQVIVTGTNPATVERAREELRGIATVVRSDSGNGADIASLFAGVVKDHGGLDVLFLNAGIVRSGSIVSLPEADFDEVTRVNVKGPWLAMKSAIPHLRRGGAVVLNASINARLGMPGTSAYAASKAALRSLARTAASELAEQGVRVNAIRPAVTRTDMAMPIISAANGSRWNSPLRLSIRSRAISSGSCGSAANASRFISPYTST